MMSEDRTRMNDFANNWLYVQMWMSREEVTLTDLRISDKVDKDDPNSNTGVVNGVQYKLWRKGRPCNRKTLQFDCCADSAMDGYPISANQAKVNIVKWIGEQTCDFYNTNKGQSTFDSLFKL